MLKQEFAALKTGGRSFLIVSLITLGLQNL